MRKNPSDSGANSPEQLLAHVDWVRALAASLVAEPADADDVAQRTWLEALERPPARATRLRNWLALVTRNAARKLGRARRARELHESRQPEPGIAPSTAELVERAELQRRVVGDLLALAEPYRATLLLRFFEGLDADEIARREGVPVETVRTRIKRGLAQLRARLEAADPERRGLAHALAPLLVPTLTLVKGVAVSVTTKAVVAAVVFAAASLVVWQVERRHRVPPLGNEAARAEDVAPALATSTPVAAARDAEPKPATADPATTPLAADAIIGIVVDEHGAPVAGARIFAGRDVDGWFNWKVAFFNHVNELESDLVRESKPQRFHGVSDANGRFQFAGLSVPDSFTFAAIDPAVGIAWRPNVHLPVAQEIRLVLQTGTVIIGKVTGPDGRLKPDVAVEVGVFDEEFNGEMTDEWIEPGQGVVICRTRTDAHGEYRTLPLRYTRVEVGVEIEPRSEDRTVISSRSPVIKVEPVERERRVDVVLAPRRKLRGRILDMNGEPARLKERLLPKLGEKERTKQNSETFEVEATAIDPRIEMHLIDDPHPRSRSNQIMWGRLDTDVDTYEIEPDTTDQRWIRLVVRTGIIGFAEIVDPEHGPDLRVDLAKIPTSKPRGRLRVHVSSGADGHDLVKATVSASYLINNGVSTSKRFAYEETDAEGRATCELFAGESSVHVAAKGFVAISRSIDVRPDADTDADFELVPATTRLRGEVVDEAGKPLGGIAIAVYRRQEEKWEAIADCEARSDALGRFEAASLPDEELEVVAFDWNRAPAHAAADDGAAERFVRITMARGVEVKIVTRTAAGGAVPHSLFRICDKEGIPLVDSHAPHMISGMFSGDGARLFLPAEELEFTVWSPDAPPVTLRATPRSNATITFTLKDY